MDKPLTAEDIATEWGDEFLRELVKELREPAPTPTPSIRANPLPRRLPWPTKLLPWQEELLVLWWRVDLNESALNALVEAHRELVEKMAKKLSLRHYRLLAEYGLLGLRVAAGPQRPSKAKKGKLAGFDPAKGYRFNTYAMRVAHRYTTAALQAMRYEADVFSECLGPRFEDSKQEFDAWAVRPIPTEIRRVRDDAEAECRARFHLRTFHRSRPSSFWADEIAELASPYSPQAAMVDYDEFRLWPVPVLGARQDILIEFA